jgi:hypothetical protein
MAIWGLVAKIEDKPLYQVLSDRFGMGTTANPHVYVYAAGGYYYDGGSANYKTK